ncbi:MAG: acyl-CoA dehydratase activase [Dehalococcoidia bacterium]|jgi:predicted CoA-substrate-specific enzyme activase
MITAGIDIGSLTGKALILKDTSVLSWSIIPTGYDSADTAKIVTEKALEQAGITMADIDYIVSTGYGRVIVPFARKNISEISCHARGAVWCNPQVRTVVDMGGQDCKSMRCDSRGNVISFAMNDKCSAGVGRYLEVMAKLLDIRLEDIGERSLDFTGDPLTISSTCVVFARSEILRSLQQGADKNKILAGLHDALVTRIYGMLNKVGLEKEFMVSGGIAKNIGIVNRLQRRVGFEFKTAFEPQIVGALGAAVLAQEALLEDAKS